MKIWGIMVYWNEEFYIRQSIYSVLPFVDKLLLIDGAYYKYDLPDYFSSDATNSYIKDLIWNGESETDIHWYTSANRSYQFYDEFPGIYTTVRKEGWEDEMMKRQFALDLIPEDDVILICDADTLMMGDPEWFREQVGELETRATMIPTMYYTHPASWWETPMLMRKVKGMEYKGIHWNIEYPDTPERNQWRTPNNNAKIVEGVFQLNMGHFYRQPRRMATKRDSVASRNLREDFGERRRKQIWDKMYYEREKLKRGEEVEQTDPFVVGQE